MQASVTALVAPDGSGERYPAVIGSYPPGYQEQGLFDLTSIRAILWRQRWVLLAVTAAVVLAGLVLTMLMTPIYYASATVRIDPQNAEILEGQELVDPYIASNEIFRHLETLKSVIESRNMALRVVDDLELDRSEALLGEAATQGPPAGTSEENWRNQMRQSAAAALMGGVTVGIPMNTRIMEIGFSSPDAGLAAQIANSYTQNFLTDNVQRSIEANSYAREYLEKEISETREELRQSELQAIEYARANRIIGQAPQSQFGEDIGTSPTLTVTNLSDVSAQLNIARGKRIDAEQRWRAVAALPAGQLPEVRENSTIQALETRLAQLDSSMSDLRERYRDDYPQLRGMEAEKATITQQIAAMSAEIKRSIRSEFDIAARQEAALANQVESISNETLDEQDRRVQYNLIARDAAASRDQLAVLLQRFNLISSAANIQRNDATLLDSALVPGAPSSPNLFTNLLLALALGIGLAVAIAVLREVFDDRLRSMEDLESKLRVPALGQTPYVTQQLDGELDSVFSPISEAYSSIRATLDFALPKAGHHVIQVTSSQPGEGKTTSTIAIATKFAMLGRRVLLIDMDLRRPAIGKALGLAKPEAGVVDVLHGRVPLETAMVTNETPNLFILGTGQIPHNPVEILSSGLVPEFIARYRREFDVIVIDSSPILGIADAPLLSRFVDAVVFVVEANRAHHGQVRMAIRRLRDMNANIIGALLTKFRALEVGKDHNYSYQYYAYGEK
jgi:capsular exopolysaccharide synthesis family protein